MKEKHFRTLGKILFDFSKAAVITAVASGAVSAASFFVSDFMSNKKNNRK
jgi:hypothetical protein